MLVRRGEGCARDNVAPGFRVGWVAAASIGGCGGATPSIER